MTKYLIVFIFSIFFGNIFSNITPHKKIKERDLLSINCKDIIHQLEKKYDIPHNLLYAIAHVESKLHPWAVNAKGQSRFFKTKDQAVNYAQGLRQKKVKNIGVGCMQINLSAHGKKFESITHAFDPAVNIDYSAKLLTSLHNRFGDWKKAVEFYHTANPRFHVPYRNRVYRIWYKIQGQHENVVSSARKHLKIGFGPGMGIGSQLN